MLGLGTLRRVAGEIRRDVAAAHDRDPAARGVSSVEILASWPGVHALLAHRVAHALHHAGVPFVPRAMSTATRAVTGIEIHPAAQIGDGLFIDHGTGVVVGETAEIGDDVTLYQGVTLGGTGFATGKRHPTVQDNVTIGSGAKLLGPITVGHGAKIGANSVVITDVPPNSTVVGNPGTSCASTGARSRAPTPTGSICPTRWPTPSRGSRHASRRSNAPLAEVAGREADPVAEVRPLRPAQGRNPAGG